jgi:hypothetical protein
MLLQRHMTHDSSMTLLMRSSTAEMQIAQTLNFLNPTNSQTKRHYISEALIAVQGAASACRRREPHKYTIDGAPVTSA